MLENAAGYQHTKLISGFLCAFFTVAGKSGITFAKEASDGEIYVDSVGSISGMGNANGMIHRYAVNQGTVP